jgi:hypothetical protein
LALTLSNRQYAFPMGLPIPITVQVKAYNAMQEIQDDVKEKFTIVK